MSFLGYNLRAPDFLNQLHLPTPPLAGSQHFYRWAFGGHFRSKLYKFWLCQNFSFVFDWKSLPLPRHVVNLIPWLFWVCRWWKQWGPVWEGLWLRKCRKSARALCCFIFLPYSLRLFVPIWMKKDGYHISTWYSLWQAVGYNLCSISGCLSLLCTWTPRVPGDLSSYHAMGDSSPLHGSFPWVA